jgi:hypothetical protein
MRNAIKTALLAASIGSAALWSGSVSAWESESSSGDYYSGYGHDQFQHSGYGHYASPAEHTFHYSDGSYYGGYYRPHDDGAYGYSYSYAGQCVRYVRVYDDYGGWVWGRQLVC